MLDSPYILFRAAVTLFLSGLLVSQWFDISFYIIETWLVFFFILGGAIFFKDKNWGLISLLIAGILYGQTNTLSPTNTNALQNFTKQDLLLEGVVSSFPEQKKMSRQAFVSVKKVCARIPEEKTTFKKISTDCHSIQEKILLITPLNIQFDYGQKLSMTGRLTKPRSFGSFDYEAYLNRFKISVILRNPKTITTIDTMKGHTLVQGAKSVRNYFENQLNQLLPEPHSTLVMGILLGVKKELPTDVKHDFQIAGLQHVLVVSGSNVSFVLLAITLLFASAGRWITFCLSLLSVLFFVLMTGADPPVIRAAIMGGTVALASALGRFSEGINLLLFSALIIALFDPLMVQHDIGFLLSFSATMGIIVLTPLIWKGGIITLQKLPLPSNHEMPPFIQRIMQSTHWKKIGLMLSVLLAAQMGVFPVLTLFFQSFSIWTFPANILAEPLIPLIMIFGLVSIVSGTILPFIIAKIFSIPAFMLTQTLIWVGQIFGQFSVLAIPFWWSCISLIVLVGVCIWAFFSPKYETWIIEFEKSIY